ncbi:MAG: ABC transporter substrate-binding protein [Anaerolineae bacterium]|nr:ABC transporter substrate-binding protein [Anaerolineae bacterium]
MRAAQVKFLYRVAVILALLPVAFAAAQSQPIDEAELIIGFSQVGSESDWRTAFTEITLAEAAERGITLLLSNAENSQENQIAAIRSFIAQGVDAILLAPVIETGWTPILVEAQAAGIPVVIIDRNVTADESLYLTRVSSNFVLEGRLAAAWLAQATSGQCNIVELQGTVGSSAARDRQIGFNQVIALFPEMRVVVSQTADFRRAMGREVMANILHTENAEEICALWSHNDDMAIGAIEAIKAAGLDPGDDILIVSVDAIPDIFAAMMAGDTNATVELSPYMAGPAFDAIVAYLNGAEVPKWIPVPGGIYFPDTAAEEYARRKQ